METKSDYQKTADTIRECASRIKKNHADHDPTTMMLFFVSQLQDTGIIKKTHNGAPVSFVTIALEAADIFNESE